MQCNFFPFFLGEMNRWKYDLLCKDFWERFNSSPSCLMTVVRDLLLVSIVFFLFFCHHGIYNRLRWLDVKKEKKKATLSTFFSRVVCQSLCFLLLLFFFFCLFFSHALPFLLLLIHHHLLSSLSCSFSLLLTGVLSSWWPGMKLSEKSANCFPLAVQLYRCPLFASRLVF